MCGVTYTAISRQLKLRGVSIRPSVAQARYAHKTKAKNVAPQEVSSPEEPVAPQKRKIISLAGNGGTGKLTYERRI